MMLWSVLIFTGLIASHSALAGEVSVQADCRHTSKSFYCVKFVQNYDGDTFTANISSVHPLLGDKITVRVGGIDTPEMHSDKPCERQAAFKAQQAVQKILAEARRIDLRNVQRDKYFRVLADVVVDGRSLADYLLRARMAVPYDGQAKEDVNWCRR
jgi:endonuclease YncB( thermonuclease family)